MLTIARLRLLSFKCYAGEVVLGLEPKAYAVTATKDGDSESSNWSGKSSLTEAVDYALTGRRPRDARLKSDWITRGEEKGEVDVTFSNGARVIRSMSRKGSERLWYYPPGDPEKGATQDLAQTAIDELLGVSREDAATWCFRQGEMSELLKMDPAPRLEMFSAWFRLGKLEECQGLAAGARGEIEKRRVEAQARLDAANLATETVLASAGCTAESLSGVIAANEAAVAEAQKVVDAERARGAELQERERLALPAARYDEIVKEGMGLARRLMLEVASREALLTEGAGLQASAGHLEGEQAKAAEALRAQAQVAEGRFDGLCPLAGAPCPSAAFVTEETLRNRKRRDEASMALDEYRAALGGVRDRLSLVQAKLREREGLENRIGQLRAAAKPLKLARDRWEELSKLAGVNGLPDAERALSEAVSRLESLKATREFCYASASKALEAATEVKTFEKVAAIPTAAALVFEKARKKIAEDVLAEIEAGSNEILGTCGVDLSVAISWGRDGAGLADACHSCGAAYPASRKVRSCSRCGAERGAKVVERLDITPSQRSGAADDFGSIGVRFASSRWLREDRESDWGVATIDEMTSQMDAGHRRALAAKLPEILRQSGFAQALVIAHHSDVLASLPGRILITSKGGKSTARVVA